MAGLITSPFSDAIETGFALTAGIFDFPDDGGENCGSLGFVDLLSMQPFSQTLFDVTPPTFLQSPAIAPQLESSDTVNLTASSNSSSISTTSIDADRSMLSLPTASPFETVDDESPELDGENKTSGSNSKDGKTKKGQKRLREPRFAFMTKSDVDHLEDGYRWRKYGQKAVKNSPFPRGYYRCTSALCGVKKKVERSFLDPRTVITTYEGQHCHPIPVMPRVISHFHPSPVLSDLQRLQAHHPIFSRFLFSLHPSDFGELISDTSTSQPPADAAATTNFERRYCKPIMGSGFSGHGLLQDLIPSELTKKKP